MLDDLEEFRAYATHLQREHRRLEQNLRRIERRWKPKRPHPPEFLSRATQDLEELRTELARHFEEEEEGGCLEEAVAHLPTLAHEATRLEREHPQLLAQVGRLIEKLRTAPQTAKTTKGVEEEFRVIAKRLRAHEAAEDSILKKSFGEDVP